MQKGNALFLILIAVALFAALSYAVTNSGRGGSNIDAEQREIFVSQILQHSTALETAVQRLMLINNCSESDLTFENPDRPGYENGVYGSPCSVFHPEGGGLQWKGFNQMFDQGNGFGQEDIVSNNEVEGVGSTCAAASCNDLLYIISFFDENPNSKPFCEAINKRVEVNSGDPPIDSNISTGSKYTGSFTYGATLGDEAPELSGKRTGCFQETTGGGNDYRYYHVILAR